MIFYLVDFFEIGESTDQLRDHRTHLNQRTLLSNEESTRGDQDQTQEFDEITPETDVLSDPEPAKVGLDLWDSASLGLFTKLITEIGGSEGADQGRSSPKYILQKLVLEAFNYGESIEI